MDSATRPKSTATIANLFCFETGRVNIALYRDNFVTGLFYFSVIFSLSFKLNT